MKIYNYNFFFYFSALSLSLHIPILGVFKNLLTSIQNLQVNAAVSNGYRTQRDIIGVHGGNRTITEMCIRDSIITIGYDMQ